MISLNTDGIIIGIASFLIIGVFHPIVIKCEYYFTKKVWPIFLILGIILAAASLYIKSTVLSAIVGVIGFSCLWSIGEIFNQEKRVEKGWFPKKPSRK